MSAAIDGLIALHERTCVQAEACVTRGQHEAAAELWKLVDVITKRITELAVGSQTQAVKSLPEERKIQ